MEQDQHMQNAVTQKRLGEHINIRNEANLQKLIEHGYHIITTTMLVYIGIGLADYAKLIGGGGGGAYFCRSRVGKTSD